MYSSVYIVKVNFFSGCDYNWCCHSIFINIIGIVIKYKEINLMLSIQCRSMHAFVLNLKIETQLYGMPF